MDEEFIRNRITELRLKKGVSEYQMSMDLGQNKNYVQAISSGRALPSMKQFLNICEYMEITPFQFYAAPFPILLLPNPDEVYREIFHLKMFP